MARYITVVPALEKSRVRLCAGISARGAHQVPSIPRGHSWHDWHAAFGAKVANFGSCVVQPELLKRCITTKDKLPDSQFLSLEGHKLMWEAVSRIHPQNCPSYTSTTNINSFIPGLFALRAPRLRQCSLTRNSQQWHSGHGYNSWSDFHTSFCPKKGPSASFFQAPRPQQRENLPKQKIMA